tara:strand:- start:2597 stop:3223 length:627 start_codon:yes stop_codon:yes gene_type:complete
MLDFRILSFSVFALCLTGCGQPQEISQASAQDETAKAGQGSNWTVIKEESFIKFSALQQGKEFEGEFTEFDADILFYPDNLDKSEVTVKIPLQSADTGDSERNNTLPGKAWFSAKSFPVATFRSDNIVETSEGSYLANGSLSMKNITRNIELPFSLSSVAAKSDEKVVMTGSMTLDRTDWKVGEEPWNTEEWVSRDIALNVQITASPE